MAITGVKGSAKGRKHQRDDQNQKKAIEEEIESLLLEIESASSTDGSTEELEARLERIAQENGALFSKRLRRFARDRDSISLWLKVIGRQPFVPSLKDLTQDAGLKASLRVEVTELLETLGEPVDHEELEQLRKEVELLRTALADLAEERREALPSLISSLHSLPSFAHSRVLKCLVQEAAEKAFPLLEALIRGEERRESSVEGAIEALGFLALPESLRLLEETARSSDNKAQQKLAKRSLYRLRSTRPDLSDLVTPSLRSEARSPLTPPKFKILHALATFVDGVGSRLFFLTKTQPMGRVKEVFIHASDMEGIQICQITEGSRKMTEAMVEEKLLSTDQWVEVDPVAWKFLVEEYRQINQTADKPLPEETLQALSLLDDLEEVSSRPPIYQSLDEKAIQEDVYLLARSPSLFGIEEFAGWLFSPAQMKAYHQNLEEAEKGAIIVSEAMKREKIEAAYQSALQELFDPESRKRYQRRLEEMAYFLWATEKEEEARIAFAAALAFESLQGERLKEHPWVREMIERSIVLIQQEEKDSESSLARPNLIIDPFRR